MLTILYSIFLELTRLKLISKLNLITLKNETRDKKIKVIKDLKTKIIFLEKYITSNEYYSLLSYGDDDRKLSYRADAKKASDKSKSKVKEVLNKNLSGKEYKANIKTFSGNIRSPIIEDDYRRAVQFEKNLKNKDILDFGCGWGGFLRNIKIINL